MESTVPQHLMIVVAPGCPQCDRARALAAALAERFPTTLRVELLDLADGRPVPPCVVATPTYLLDGVVIALGNPYPETLEMLIAEHGRRNKEASALEVGMADGAITVYATAWCGDCRRAREVLDAHGARYRWVDIDADPAMAAEVLRRNGGRRSVPTLLFPDGSALVGPSDQALAARLAALTDDPPTAAAGGTTTRDWPGRSVAAGVGASVVASLCCLPAAAALALGLGLGTAATLGRLLAFQRLFQLAGLALAVLAARWIAGRRGASCRLSPRERERVPLYVFGAFALGFLTLNLGLIPLLERLPALLAGH